MWQRLRLGAVQTCSSRVKHDHGFDRAVVMPRFRRTRTIRHLRAMLLAVSGYHQPKNGITIYRRRGPRSHSTSVQLPLVSPCCPARTRYLPGNEHRPRQIASIDNRAASCNRYVVDTIILRFALVTTPAHRSIWQSRFSVLHSSRPSRSTIPRLLPWSTTMTAHLSLTERYCKMLHAPRSD